MDAATIWFGVLQAATLLARPRADLPPARRLHRARLHVRAETSPSNAARTALIGVDPRSEQTWQAYLRGVLVFSALGVLLVYALQRFQAVLPYSLGLPAVPEGLSFNTAVSFVTNTNWQSYSPELTLGYTVQLAGLAVQNFVSAAVGHRRRGRSRPRLRRPPFRHASATSGSTSSAGSCACCCRCRSSRRSRCIVGGVVQNFERLHRGRHAHRRNAGDPRRTGRLAGGDQGARHERRRILQRELRAPVREPDAVDEPLRDPAAARDPRGDAARVRADGRRQPAGLRDPRRDGDDRDRLDHRRLVARSARPGHRAPARRRSDGGQGDAVRHPRVDPVRRRDHAHLDRRGQLDARQLHGPGRHDADAQHDARRGRPRRRRVGSVRDADPRRARRLRRRTAGRPQSRVPRQADRAARDQAREPVHPRHAHPRAARHRAELRRSRRSPPMSSRSRSGIPASTA